MIPKTSTKPAFGWTWPISAELSSCYAYRSVDESRKCRSRVSVRRRNFCFHAAGDWKEPEPETGGNQDGPSPPSYGVLEIPSELTGKPQTAVSRIFQLHRPVRVIVWQRWEIYVFSPALTLHKCSPVPASGRQQEKGITKRLASFKRAETVASTSPPREQEDITLA